MRDAKSWLILVMALGAAGGWAGCSGKRITTVGDMDSSAADMPTTSAGGDATSGSNASAGGDATSGSNAGAGGDASSSPVPTCTDAVRNGAETDVDCGGPLCAPCLDEGHCQDGIRNGSETDVDCGGSICDKCAVDAICLYPEDCESGLCWTFAGAGENVCWEPHCGNGLKDADESDEDCGGTECPVCAPGQACGGENDCYHHNECRDDVCVTVCDSRAFRPCGEQAECIDDRCVECAVPADCPTDWCGGEPCACQGGMCRPE